MSHDTNIVITCQIEYKATYKYASEARFCLGVAKVTLNDGRVFERRARVFDYSKNKIVSIVEWKRRAKEEFMKIKNLPSSSSSWVKDNRGDKSSHPKIFDNDDLNRFQGLTEG